MDRLYVYLIDPDNVPVCFWKGKVADFTERNCRHRWYPMVNDEYHGKVNHAHQAGLLQFKLSINCLENNPAVNWSQFASWKKKLAKYNRYDKVRCFIFQAKDLPSADADGMCDARV